MLKRTITGAVMTLLAIPVCIYSSTLIFPAVIALLSLVGTWEMLRCIGCIKRAAISLPLMTASFVFPLLAGIISDRSAFISLYAAVMLVIMIYMLALPVFTLGKTDVSEISLPFVSASYITASFVSVVLLRYGENGVYYFLVPIVGPMISDIFAYFSGRLFGRHKLIPQISPNKTVEGSLGGIVFCTAVCTAYGTILQDMGISDSMLPAWAFAVGGIIISVVSQIGDLIASAIKRKYDIKDYGWIFPGHGGVMDRFDSVLATAPLFLIFTVLFGKLGL